MPHIRLEYSSNIEQNINFKSLFSELHLLIHQISGANIENCKSRVIKLDNYFIGNGMQKNAFVFVEILLLEGRSNEAKKTLGEAILETLNKNYTVALTQLDLKITVKITEMPRELYFKS